jgi:hypothetical protein
MKTIKTCLTSALLAVLFVGIANAMPLNSSARAVVPADLQQLISVDYRALKDSPTAMQLKEQLMPDNIKEFEAALKGVGIDPNKDVDTLTFASFRTAKQGIKGVGVAAGPFAMKAVIKKMTMRKIKPTKYRLANIYPMDGGMVMTFLDDSTLLFGEISAVKLALDTRDGDILNLDTNSIMSDMMSDVDSGPVWSILDQLGTQNVMHSALGEASKVADFETIKKRLLGGRRFRVRACREGTSVPANDLHAIAGDCALHGSTAGTELLRTQTCPYPAAPPNREPVCSVSSRLRGPHRCRPTVETIGTRNPRRPRRER